MGGCNLSGDMTLPPIPLIGRIPNPPSRVTLMMCPWGSGLPADILPRRPSNGGPGAGDGFNLKRSVPRPSLTPLPGRGGRRGLMPATLRNPSPKGTHPRRNQPMIRLWG